VSNDYQIQYNTFLWSASILYKFQLPSVDYITKLIIRPKPSTCSLDPLPTILVLHLFKCPYYYSYNELFIIYCYCSFIIKMNFHHSKNVCADYNDLNNYRPNSNLAFI